MKKTISTLILLMLILPFVFANAQSEKKSTAVPDDVEWVTTERIGNPNAPNILRYSVGLSYSHQVNNEARVKHLVEASTKWAKTHPDYQLIVEIQSGSLDQVLQKMLQQLASNTAPDFAMIDGMYVPLFYDYLTPLNGVISQDEIDDFFDWTKDTMIDQADGKLKSLWFTSTGAGLWYRKDLIKDVPRTWDEFIATGLQLKKTGYAEGLITWGAKNEQITFANILPMFYGLGGDLVDSKGKPIFGVGANRSNMIEVFKFWKEAVVSGVVSDRIIGIGADGDIAADASKLNQVAMIFANTMFISQLRSVTGTDFKNWAFTYIPQKNEGSFGQVAGGWNWGFFTKDPGKLAAAVDFVQECYTSLEGMAGWCAAGGYTPTRNSVNALPYFANDEEQNSFAKVISVARTRPGVAAYNVITINLQNAWQAVILGMQTPEEAVDDAYAKTIDQI